MTTITIHPMRKLFVSGEPLVWRETAAVRVLAATVAVLLPPSASVYLFKGESLLAAGTLDTNQGILSGNIVLNTAEMATAFAANGDKNMVVTLVVWDGSAGTLVGQGTTHVKWHPLEPGTEPPVEISNPEWENAIAAVNARMDDIEQGVGTFAVDVEVTDLTKGIILRGENGRYRLRIDDSNPLDVTVSITPVT